MRIFVVAAGRIREKAVRAVADDYLTMVEQAVRRVAGSVAWVDPRTGSLLAQVFGRPVLVVASRPRGSVLTAEQFNRVAAATDWRLVAGLVVLSELPPDPDVGAVVREARQRGFAVDAVQWQDERDDGVLKRVLVRLAG